MKKLLSLFLIFFPILRGVTAQNIYESIGKKADILTLSEGKYQEIFTNDTLVRIGSVLFNRVTNEVVEFVTKKDSNSLVEADVASRFLSVDPIGREYPELSPYQFAGNTPIQAIDLDGLEPTYPKQPYEAIIIPSTATEINGKFSFEVTTHTGTKTTMDYSKGNKGTFSNAQVWRFSQLAEINHTVKNNGAEYGTEYSNKLCAYDCLTLAIGQAELLFGEKLPRVNSMRPWLTEMANQGYAGEESTVNFADKDGRKIENGERNIGSSGKNPKIGYFEKTFSETLVEMAGDKKGLHVFGVALGDGFHSITATLNNSDPSFDARKPVFQVFDQTTWTHNEGKIGSTDLDFKIRGYLITNSNTNGGVGSKQGDYQTYIREYINKD